jgi:integration host factor subunit alpha
MNKEAIVSRVTEKTSRQDASNIIEATFEIIKGSLQRGEKVKIKNFGNFSVHAKNERRGRNPYTGAEIVIPARKVVTFSPSPTMKKTINPSNSSV